MVGKLDLYKVFRTVGFRKSFSKAAVDLYMTQPAVSQAIQQLERELDTRLFNRTPRGVSLTNEGSLLYEYVNSAIHLLEIGEQKILEFKNLTVGELKIGVGDTISRYFLLPYLETFRNRYPSIKFKIVNGTTLEINAILKSGDVDIAICNFPIDDPTLELRACMEIQDIFVCGERDRHRFTRPLSLEEIARLPLILLERKSNSRKYVEDYMRSRGVQIAPEFELGSHELLLEFAQIHLGVACVIREFSLEYLKEKRLYEIPVAEAEAIPKRSAGVCYLKNVPLSPASTKFVELLMGERMAEM